MEKNQQMATIVERPIRDLVDDYPEIMTILAPLGIDLCCGGAHPLGEALDLHGLDRPSVVRAVARILAEPGDER